MMFAMHFGRRKVIVRIIMFVSIFDSIESVACLGVCAVLVVVVVMLAFSATTTTPLLGFIGSSRRVGHLGAPRLCCVPAADRAL